MKKIAIIFGDNDFGSTFRGVLEFLEHAIMYKDELPKDKEKLCFLINNISPIAYLAYQNQWEYNGLQHPTDNNKEFLRTKEYLQITPDRILINEEVDDYVKDGKWNNSETFVLDMTLYNNRIYYI